MKNFFYYNVIRKSTIQVLDMFNDVQIARYERGGVSIRKMIKVPLKFAPKEKGYNWLYNKSKQRIVPMMSLELSGIEYDVTRQTNKDAKITISQTPSSGEIRQFLNPVPYNINYDLNIITDKMDDVTQVIEQILPFFKPNAAIRVIIPEIDTQIEMKMINTGSSQDFNADLPGDEYRLLKWTMTYTLHGWVFPPLEINPLIMKVIQNLYADKNGFNSTDKTTSPFVSGGGDPHKEGSYAWSTSDVTIFTKALNLTQTGEVEYLEKKYGAG